MGTRKSMCRKTPASEFWKVPLEGYEDEYSTRIQVRVRGQRSESSSLLATVAVSEWLEFRHQITFDAKHKTANGVPEYVYRKCPRETKVNYSTLKQTTDAWHSSQQDKSVCPTYRPSRHYKR